MPDNWDQYIEQPKDKWDEYAQPVDKLTEQTQATAKAAGAPTGPEPMPSGYEPVTAGNDETKHPNNPIYQKLAQNDQLTKRAHTLQGMPSSYDAPLTNALGAKGLAELPGAIANSGNWLAGHMREPATAAESLAGKAGAPKNILPRSMQRWTIPDWVAEGITPVGEKGTPTNPGPFRNWMGKNTSKLAEPSPFSGMQSTAIEEAPKSTMRERSIARRDYAGLPTPEPPSGGPVTSTGPQAEIMPPRGYPAPESSPTATGTPGNGIYVSRMGRKWSAGDLAQMPREQLAGEYAKEIAKPVPQQDQEWMTALKAESQRNTKGMYPGAAASTKGGAKLQ